MKRLFITLPDPLPEKLDALSWHLHAPQAPQATSSHGEATCAKELPAADETWLALPAARVLLSSLKISRRALRQLQGDLSNALEDQLMLDPSSVHIALGKPLANDIHPVAIVDKAWLEQALTLCRQHEIEAHGATPETLLWIDEDPANQWCIRWNGQRGFVRCGPCAGFALDDGNADTPPLALQLALAEAAKPNAVCPPSPHAMVIETEMTLDVAAWSRNLNCPVRQHALRLDPHPPAINLLQGAYAANRRAGAGGSALNTLIRLGTLLGGQPGSPHRSKYRIAAGIAIAALGVHVLGTTAEWLQLSRQNQQLRDEMRQVYLETFPETQTIVDPILQMQRQLADLRRARGYAENGDFLHALAAIGSHSGSTLGGLNYENGRLTLVQPGNLNPDMLRASLAAQGYQISSGSEAGNPTLTLQRSLQ